MSPCLMSAIRYFVSGSFAKGCLSKRKTFSVACEKDEYLKAFKSLGTNFNLEQSTFAFLCQYVCHLYDQPAADNVNEARYKAFCMTSSALPELSIPPTTDALHQHCKRANYQAAIMRSCLKQNISAPSPAGYGWQIEDGNLHVTWMTRNPAPDSVLHVIHCGCKGACETDRCSCFSAGLCCTDLCRCRSCANTKESEELEDNCPDTDTDSEDWVSLICYFLFSFVQFYISYFMFHKECFYGSLVLFSFVEEWMNEWMNKQMVIGISTITAFYWYMEVHLSHT